MSKTKEFKRLFNFLEKLHQRYLFAYGAFSVWLTLKKKIKKRKFYDIYQRYNQFFIITHESLRVYFLIELAKIFDNAEQSLHINKIVNYAESNIKKLGKSDFLKFHGDREFNKELFNEYTELKKSDLNLIKEKLKKLEKSLKKLSDYRGSYLAHSDIKLPKINLTLDEIKRLFNLAEEIFNLFSLRLDFSHHYYEYSKEQCQEHTEWLMKDLIKFKAHEIKMFDKKWER
ncbi:MAG: hypothetical protein ACFFDN_31705 [Candidatus Hodarchaeota archaeon]